MPDRISIAGFGDYEIAGISVPALTTINPFPREIGAQTAELILEVLDGSRKGAATLAITPALLVRQSSR